MVKVNGEDLENINSAKPLIRTMEDDIRSLRAIPPQKNAQPDFSQAPKNLPIGSKTKSGYFSDTDKKTMPEYKPFGGKDSLQRPASAEPINAAEKQGEAKITAGKPAEKTPPVPETPPPVKKENFKPTPPKKYFKPAEEEKDLPPEARLAMQESSFSIDLKEEIKKSPLSALGKNHKPGSLALPASSGATTEAKRVRTSSFIGNILKYLVLMILIILISYGIYFYFIKGNQNRPPVVKEEIPELVVPGVRQYEIKTDFGAELASVIKRHIKDNGNSVSTGASRLIIKDADGAKLLKAGNFKEALKINIPASIESALDAESYNLLAFDYPSRSYERLGLVFKIKDSASISRLAGNWEPTMFQDLEPLFLGSTGFYVPAKSFNGNTYKEASIRYLTLGKEDAALNYGIDKDKKFFLLATSKDDIYYLIDKVSP